MCHIRLVSKGILSGCKDCVPICSSRNESCAKIGGDCESGGGEDETL